MKAHLAVVSCATLMVLVSATVAACTGAPASSVPAIFSPSGTATPSGTGTGTSKPALAPSGTGTATTATSTATHTATTSAATAQSQAATAPPPTATTSKPATPVSPTTQPPTHTQSPVPQGAPETGGGGTAGLQDGLAIGLGLGAILAGLGSLAYRRRLNRRR
jgi:hypothetical protein